MRTKKKIVIIINTVTPYQIDFFENLNSKADIKVIFHSKNFKNYNFNFREKSYHSFLDSKNRPLKHIQTLIHNFNPDLIIFGGYRLKYNSKIITFLKQKKIKYFFWLENLNEKNYIKFNLVKYLISKKIKQSNGVLAVGKKAKKLYSKYSNNVINFPYSIKINKLKKKKFFHNKKINFLFVGQLIERKGFNNVLNVFEKLSVIEKNKVRLNIIGDGNLKKSLNKYLEKNSFASYYGFLFGKKLSKIYEKSDVLLFPSLFDGWGVVPMEAMSNSLSLIISKNAGVKEILKNVDNGYIIEPNSTALYKTVKNCIKDAKIIKRQGYNNRKLIFNSICNVHNSTDLFMKKVFKIK